MHVADELQLEAKQLPPLNVKPSASSMASGDPTPPINSSRALIAEVSFNLIKTCEYILIAEVRCLLPLRRARPLLAGPKGCIRVRSFSFSPNCSGPKMLFLNCLHPCVRAADIESCVSRDTVGCFTGLPVQWGHGQRSCACQSSLHWRLAFRGGYCLI